VFFASFAVNTYNLWKGVKDMDYIWAPWRMEYILMEKPEGCILCAKPKENQDDANYILYRGKYNFVMLNAFPYNPGHLMVAPYRHISRLEDLTTEELNEHVEIIRRVACVIKEIFQPDGFNLGMNLGRIAGAGIADHLHSHIVPRWSGDTNFMPAIAETRVVAEALTSTYQRLKGKI
jgi:ATP adenylyltransferase